MDDSPEILTDAIARLRAIWGEIDVLPADIEYAGITLLGRETEETASSMELCAVVRCPVCERQRPYPISRSKFEAGKETYRLEQGVGLHISATHSVGDDRDVLVDRAIHDAELRKVPEEMLEQVDTGDRRWDAYGL